MLATQLATTSSIVLQVSAAPTVLYFDQRTFANAPGEPLDLRREQAPGCAAPPRSPAAPPTWLPRIAMVIQLARQGCRGC